MQKLQELITKHAASLRDGRDWEDEYLLIDGTSYRQYGTVIIDWWVAWETWTAFSLSDLLFSTPFLSLLEWKEQSENPRLRCYFNWDNVYDGIIDELHPSHTDFHKINLALLESDKERCEYIESFTL